MTRIELICLGDRLTRRRGLKRLRRPWSRWTFRTWLADVKRLKGLPINTPTRWAVVSRTAEYVAVDPFGGCR